MSDDRPYDVAIADTQTAMTIDAARLRDVVCQTLAAEKVASANISLAIVDNATLRELNVRHLGHDDDTDVLSFLFDCQPVTSEGSKTAPRGTGKRLDGEVVISAEMARERAGEAGWRPEDEITLYLVHGLLHLCGYDDVDEGPRQEMRRREREILATLNVNSSGERPA